MEQKSEGSNANQGNNETTSEKKILILKFAHKQ